MVVEHPTTLGTFEAPVVEDPVLAEALRKVEELRLALESARCEVEKWRGAFRRALALAKALKTDGEAARLRRELETVTSVGENLRSRGRTGWPRICSGGAVSASSR